MGPAICVLWKVGVSPNPHLFLEPACAATYSPCLFLGLFSPTLLLTLTPPASLPHHSNPGTPVTRVTPNCGVPMTFSEAHV